MNSVKQDNQYYRYDFTSTSELQPGSGPIWLSSLNQLKEKYYQFDKRGYFFSGASVDGTKVSISEVCFNPDLPLAFFTSDFGKSYTDVPQVISATYKWQESQFAQHVEIFFDGEPTLYSSISDTIKITFKVDEISYQIQELGKIQSEGEKFNVAYVPFTNGDGKTLTIGFTCKDATNYSLDKCTMTPYENYPIVKNPTDFPVSQSLDFDSSNKNYQVYETNNKVGAAEMPIQYKFEFKTKTYKVTWNENTFKNCTMTVVDSKGNVISNGDEVKYATMLAVTLKPDEEYRVISFTYTNSDGTKEITDDDDLSKAIPIKVTSDTSFTGHIKNNKNKVRWETDNSSLTDKSATCNIVVKVDGNEISQNDEIDITKTLNITATIENNDAKARVYMITVNDNDAKATYTNAGVYTEMKVDVSNKIKDDVCIKVLLCNKCTVTAEACTDDENDPKQVQCNIILKANGKAISQDEELQPSTDVDATIQNVEGYEYSSSKVTRNIGDQNFNDNQFKFVAVGETKLNAYFKPEEHTITWNIGPTDLAACGNITVTKENGNIIKSGSMIKVGTPINVNVEEIYSTTAKVKCINVNSQEVCSKSATVTFEMPVKDANVQVVMKHVKHKLHIVNSNPTEVTVVVKSGSKVLKDNDYVYDSNSIEVQATSTSKYITGITIYDKSYFADPGNSNFTAIYNISEDCDAETIKIIIYSGVEIPKTTVNVNYSKVNTDVTLKCNDETIQPGDEVAVGSKLEIDASVKQ